MQTIKTTATGDWWKQPGIGISYQGDVNPELTWDRNYTKLNPLMMDKNGGLNYEGRPDFNVEQFVKVSQEVGAEYHMFFTKWSDGICLFDTELTNWKTPKDYTAEFSKLSREQGIPFVFFYSSIWDHNPQLDHIQPNKKSNVSFIQHHEYIEYIQGQFRELIEKYQPDGLWLDAWWNVPFMAATTRKSYPFIRANYPDVVLGFNTSSIARNADKVLDYTSGEMQTLNNDLPSAGSHLPGGRIVNLIFNITVELLTKTANAWKYANRNRMNFVHPWEGITSVSNGWNHAALREDIYDLPRIAATIMANGGRCTMGFQSDINGNLVEDQVEQMRIVGKWYKPRKQLFSNAKPLRYKGYSAPGIIVPRGYKTIASQAGDDVLIHIIKLEGYCESGLSGEIKIASSDWPGLKEVFLEPEHRSVQVRSFSAWKIIELSESDEDPVDTILRLKLK